MAATEPLLIACKQGPTVSVNLQVPAGTKASGLQQLLAAANGVDVSNDVTIKVKTGTTGLSCFKNLGQLLAREDPPVAAHWQIDIQGAEDRRGAPGQDAGPHLQPQPSGAAWRDRAGPRDVTQGGSDGGRVLWRYNLTHTTLPH